MRCNCDCRSADSSAQQVVGADAHIGPLVRFHRNCRACGNAATVAPRAYFFCLARKSRQKDALGDAIYCALTRANFWPLRGLNALTRANFWPLRGLNALTGAELQLSRIAFGSDIAYRFVGADAHIGPYNLLCRILTAEYSQNEQNQDPLPAIRDCL